MEWVDGISVGDREALMRAGHDTARLATLVTQSFLTHALRDGFFHADMHQGNLFVDAEGRLVAVDFGIMGRLDPASRRYLAEILFGFLTRDYRRIAEVHFEAGYVPERHARESFAQALRAIGEPIFGRSAGDISMARLLAQLFETTALFDMALRPELVLLQKTMVVVEGVARKLDPEHNLWESARPVLERWMAHELSPEARLHSAAEGAASLGRVIAGLPTFLRTVEGAAATYAAHGLKLDAETIAAIGRAEAGHGRRQRLALWIIAAALVALVLLLL
jgi:ubiquinone biosynthesis protein